MAYENSDVSVSRSQESIRKLLRSHGCFGFNALSAVDPTGKHPSIEGYEAQILLDGKPYRIRIVADVPSAPDRRSKGRIYRGTAELTDKQKIEFIEKAERRIWRVFYYSLKANFEAADTGVLEFREIMLPYLVMSNDQTVGKHLLKSIDLTIQSPARMLTQTATA
jgi:hypothetical protein